MDDSRCVLCGEEVPFRRRCAITLYKTNQLACANCQRIYESAPPEEREALSQQALRSPHLEDRAAVQRNHAALLEEVRQRQLQQQEQQATLRQQEQKRARLRQQRTALQQDALQCCGQTMTEQRTLTIQLGKETLFLGDLPHLLAGGLDLVLFRCDRCGQVKFFDPSFLKDPVFADES